MLADKLTKLLLHTTDNYIKALEKGWVICVWDLLKQYPREYEDRTKVLDNFSLINVKEKNTILVKLLSLNTSKTWWWKLLSKAVIEDKNWFMSEAVWFNRKYLATTLKPSEWKKILVTWKVKYAFWKITFQSPEVETDLSKVSWEIVSIYSDINYIPSKWTSKKIELLKKEISNIDEDLPETIIKKYNFISKKEAVYKIHFPQNKHDLELAKYRLSYWELFDINYIAISKKYESFAHSEWKSLAIKMNTSLIKEIIWNLAFELTDHQKIVLFQLLKDMEKTHSMQRLLEWDVWTGKTIVALIAGIHSIVESRKNTSPQPSPLEERGQEISIRKFELKSPWYIFDLAKKFRKTPTNSENKVWKLIKNNKLNNIKFRRQHPIWRYIADFYSEELKLILELDWKIHDNINNKEYDDERDNLLKNYWFKILRLKNEEILDNTDEEILQKLSNSPLLQRRGVRGEVVQVAIMAPTEILARQHFASMQELLMKYKISSHLLVGSLTAKQKKEVKADIKSGNIDLVIWTHALVQEDVNFYNLWFVVVDEQHRFWVKQREVLEKWFGNKTGLVPHVLNMTATPIPRTLALTLYGDQDLSIISEYPKWRKEIFTKVARTESARSQIELFVRAEIEKWRQVFWISPLVEESEKIDLANAINTYEFLSDVFHPFRVWLLHGKMKAKEKDEVMKEFSDNKIQILSSTSVVEVWVDIPNSTIMCIEWAERFWLSQLHQFRWRVGRWKHQSYCYLFPTKWNHTDRLKAMEKTNNWFELAEIDLELRWPWEVYWVRQSGLPDLKIADLRDLELVSQIREDIEELFEKKK